MKKKIFFIFLISMILLLGTLGVWYFIRTRPQAAEVIGTPETVKILKAPLLTINGGFFRTQNPARLYTSDGNGIQIFDVSDQLHPQLLGERTITSTPVTKIYVDGNYLYGFQSYYLNVYDISNPAQINFVSRIQVPEQTWYQPRSFDYYNDKIYATTQGASGSPLQAVLKLKVIDVSNPTAMIVEKTLNVDGGVAPTIYDSEDTKVKEFNNRPFLFTTNGTNGLKIVDLSTDQVIGIVRLTGIYGAYTARNIVFKDNYVYVSVGNGGFQAIDLTGIGTPSFSPQVVAKDFFTGGWISLRSMMTYNNYLVAVNEGIVTNMGAYLFDISDPASPALVTIANAPAGVDKNFPGIGASYDLAIDPDGFLFLFDEDTLFDIYDLQNLASTPYALPSQLAPVLNKPWDVTFLDNEGMVAITTTGLSIFDVATPTKPVYKSRWWSRNDTPLGIQAWGTGVVTSKGNNIIYSKTATGGQFTILDAANLNDPIKLSTIALFSTIDSWTPTDILVDGNFAYIIGNTPGKSGLHIIDITDPANPVIKSFIQLSGYPWRLAYKDNRVYVGDRNSNPSVKVVDVTDPSQPALLNISFSDQNSQPVPAEFSDVNITGNRLLLSNFATGIYIYDISNADAPLYLSNINDSTFDVDVVGNIAYTLDTNICVYDIETPTAPRQLNCGGNNIPPGIVETRMTVKNDLAFTTGYDPTPNTTVRIIALPPEARTDLTISKTVSDSDQTDVLQTNSSVGELLTYKLNYTNAGNTNLTNAIISDTLPSKTSYDSGGTFDSTNKVVSFDVGTLSAGQSGQAIFKVKVDSDLAVGTYTIINSGKIETTELTRTSNEVVTNVLVAPEETISMEIDKTVSDSDEKDKTQTISNKGETLTYKINWKNTSSINLTEAQIKDNLPADTTYENGGNYDSGNKIIVFALGTLMPGQSGQVTFEVKIYNTLTVGRHTIVNYGTFSSKELPLKNSNQVTSIVTVSKSNTDENKPPIIPPVITTLFKSGAGLGVVTGIAVIGTIGVFYLIKKRKNKKLEKQNPDMKS